MKLDPLEKKVLSTIHEYRMINSGDKIIVAVSGGPDSVCLLRNLSRFQEFFDMELIIAHFNHGLRPDEDEKEEKFVFNMSRQINAEFICEQAGNNLRKTGSSLEERARNIRYQFLEGALQKSNAQKVALGHNLNDQAETVLMNLMRGSGVTGMSGMHPVRENRFIRPLINITRDEINNYLKKYNIPFMVDSSNLDKRYFRNKIRLEIIPYLTKYQPNIIQHLDRYAFLSRQENEYIDEKAKKALEKVSLDLSRDSLEISLEGLAHFPLPLQYRIIRQAIKKIKGDIRRITAEHTKRIVSIINNAKPQININLPDNLIVNKSYKKMRFHLGGETSINGFFYLIKGKGKFYIPEIKKTIALDEICRKDFSLESVSKFEAFLDLNNIHWPIRVRNFRPGDKFIPFGLSGFKKVKDIFIDNKVPSEERKKMPILESNENIIWVCGTRIDNRYRIKKETERILKCTIE